MAGWPADRAPHSAIPRGGRYAGPGAGDGQHLGTAPERLHEAAGGRPHGEAPARPRAGSRSGQPQGLAPDIGADAHPPPRPGARQGPARRRRGRPRARPEGSPPPQRQRRDLVRAMGNTWGPSPSSCATPHGEAPARPRGGSRSGQPQNLAPDIGTAAPPSPGPGARRGPARRRRGRPRARPDGSPPPRRQRRDLVRAIGNTWGPSPSSCATPPAAAPRRGPRGRRDALEGKDSGRPYTAAVRPHGGPTRLRARRPNEGGSANWRRGFSV